MNMMCTVLLSYVISVMNGPYECRIKHYDRDTAVQMMATLNNPKFKEDLAKSGVTLKNLKWQQVAPFECGDVKVNPDDQHNGCLGVTDKKSGTEYASKN